MLIVLAISQLRDLSGSHTLPLLTFGLVSAAGSWGFLFLGDPKPSPSQETRHGLRARSIED